MLKLRDEQMAAIERGVRMNLARRLSPRLRGPCSLRAAPLTPGDFELLVYGGVERAARYGIVDEPDVERFLRFLLVDGATLERDLDLPIVKEILEDDDVEGAEKLDELEEFFSTRGEE